jgi:hypothetical protein
MDVILKKCIDCLNVLPVDKFNKKNPKTGTLKSKCKECEYKDQKIWAKNNKDKVRKIQQRYDKKLSEERKRIKEIKIKKREIEKETIKLQKLELKRIRDEKRLENERLKYEEKLRKKEYINGDEYRNKRESRKKEIGRLKYKKKMENPLYRFRKKISTNIRNSIVRQGYSKKSSACQILGDEWEVVYEYFNNLFLEGMSWENHGEWHIDHIIPISTAKSEEEIIKLSHYTNLQPLWAEDNLLKSNKLL